VDFRRNILRVISSRAPSYSFSSDMARLLSGFHKGRGPGGCRCAVMRGKGSGAALWRLPNALLSPGASPGSMKS
jgi:hypothetical protein